ncbi:MAG: response regulator, partial [Bacteroidota bacterium]
VEDMALSRKMTKLVLEKMGCKVKYAENGEQAIDIIVASNDPFDDTHSEPIDIILMDQNMPGISGVATLQYLRKLLDDLPPVIALTADDSLMRDSMFGEYGFSDFLLKPFTPEHLYASVKNCMEISKAKRKRAAAEPLPFNIKQYTKSKAG